MMEPLTQKDWIEAELRQNGEISRNQCLKMSITRLAKYIGDLKKDGWEFKPESRKTNSPFKWCGVDYFYVAITIPPTKELKC